MRKPTENPDLLAALNELNTESTGATARPLTAAQQARLEQNVLARLRAEQHGQNAEKRKTQTAEPRPTPRVYKAAPQPKAHATARRRLITGVAAAAACCLLGTTALALGPALLQMLQGKVDFFEQAPAQSQVADPADAPRGDYDATQASIEAYNAPVGQTAESNGVTITLDSISMDSASMNAFFTITGERAVVGVIDGDDYQPTWNQLWMSAPRFRDVTVNGEPLAEFSHFEFYRQDDSTLKLWCHYLLSEIPTGEQITVALVEDGALDVTGEWRFTATLDGSSVRAGGKTVALGETYETAGEPLTLTTLAFGPVGGVVGAKTSGTTIDGDKNNGFAYQGLDTSLLYIVDDTGKELYLTRDKSGGFAAEGEIINYYNLTQPDPAATALTITPVQGDWHQSGEQITLTTEEMKNGAKIETSPLGGYTVQNFQIQGGVITWQLVPYGWNNGVSPEILADDEDLISLAKSEATLMDGQTVTAWHSALGSDTFDPQTGVYTCRLDYYAATQEQLEQITTWRYYRSSAPTLDTAHAITLPLVPVE